MPNKTSLQGNFENFVFWPKTILKISENDQIEKVGQNFLNALYDGVCVDTADMLDYTCYCDDWWIGKDCETPTACEPEPCQNGATCADGDDLVNYFCSCTAGWAGQDCDIPIPCENPVDPCQNSGVCTNSGDFLSFTCDCSFATDLNGDQAWTGDVCEIPIPCVNPVDPCQNLGTCINDIDFLGYTCDCSTALDTLITNSVPAWTGTDCEIPIPCINPGNPGFFGLREIQGDPCENSGTCINDADFLGYTCNCATADHQIWTGYDCEMPIPCSNDAFIGGSDNPGFPGSPRNPCFNDVRCTNSLDYLDFTCDCESRWTGMLCATKIPCEWGFLDTPGNPCYRAFKNLWSTPKFLEHFQKKN